MKQAEQAATPRQIRDLPGPKGYPVIGSLLEIKGRPIHLAAEQWASEYGDVFHFKIPGRHLVVFSHPDAVGAILRDRPGGFQRSDRTELVARELRFDGLFSSNGESWKRQRPMVLASLDPSHIRTFFPTLAKVTGRLQQRWRQAARRGESIELQGDLMRFTVDVTAGLAFGSDINTIESDEEVIQTHLEHVFPAFFKRMLAPFPYWRYFKLKRDRILDQHLDALTAAIDGFIAAARGRLAKEPQLREHPSNLIEAMLVAMEQPGSKLTDEELSGNVLTMLLAGEDTTANTLAWLIWLLATNPASAARASREVDEVLRGAELAGSVDALSHLNYLEACAHEAMRLRPVAPFIGLQAVNDTTVSGVRLPAGTVVWCLVRPGGLDEKLFPEPRSFRPERWLGAAAQSASGAKRTTMPFGAGPRMCPGRYLALAEIKMVMATLLGNFELESVATADGSEPAERIALTMSPVGLQLRLKERARNSIVTSALSQ